MFNIGLYLLCGGGDDDGGGVGSSIMDGTNAAVIHSLHCRFGIALHVAGFTCFFCMQLSPLNSLDRLIANL